VSRLVVAVGLVVAIFGGSLVAQWTTDGGVRGGGQLIPISRFEVTSGRWRPVGTDGTSARTASPVFRARSKRSDLGSPQLRLRFRIDRFAEGPDPHDWDGVHVGLRYASPDDLYYVSVARRDGSVAVKRKSRGRYETLAVADHELSLGDWHRATIAVADTPDGTRLRLAIDGEPVLEVLDGIAHALPPGGRVLLRSDNVSATFDDVRVRDLGDLDAS